MCIYKCRSKNVIIRKYQLYYIYKVNGPCLKTDQCCIITFKSITQEKYVMFMESMGIKNSLIMFVVMLNQNK